MSCFGLQSIVIPAKKGLSSQTETILARSSLVLKDPKILTITFQMSLCSPGTPQLQKFYPSYEKENPGSPAEYRLVIQQSLVSQLKLVSGYLSARQAFHSSICNWLRPESLLNISSSPYKGILLQYLLVASCSAEFSLVPLLNSLGT